MSMAYQKFADCDRNVCRGEPKDDYSGFRMISYSYSYSFLVLEKISSPNRVRLRVRGWGFYWGCALTDMDKRIILQFFERPTMHQNGYERKFMQALQVVHPRSFATVEVP